jgi:glucose/arabinose dehydrogenase
LKEDRMSLSSLFARLIAVIGGVMILLRRRDATAWTPAMGASPAVPEAKSQAIPTLKMPTAKGWAPGQMPRVAAGLKVNAFATGLEHPRSLEILPNGDVLTAEAMFTPGGIRNAFDYAMFVTMKRAAATGDSPNRVILLRDADGDGVAEVRDVFLDGQNQPFGLAWLNDKLYLGNVDALVAFPFTPGPTRLTAPGKTLARFPAGGHWTRSLILSPDRTKLYVGVGSQSNIGDDGLGVEEGRAMIQEYDLATGTIRPFATGLRNPVGMAWTPGGALFTVVNERDGLGDETPPDYLTRVTDGGFYGWPWCYWGQIVDDRVPANPGMVAKAIRPDYALGGHTASLGLCWHPAGTLPGYGDGMVIGQHGSWNRSKLSGYRVVFVPFVDGKPEGEARVILDGFLSPDEKYSYGRPVGVALKDGALLVADDVGNVIWRMTGA